MTLGNDFSRQPAFSSAVCTTRRDPDPCPRISRLGESNCSRVSRPNSKSAGAINTISSSMNGSVLTSRSRSGPSIKPIATLSSNNSRTISAVFPLCSDSCTRGCSLRNAPISRGNTYCAMVVDTPSANSSDNSRLPTQVSPQPASPLFARTAATASLAPSAKRPSACGQTAAHPGYPPALSLAVSLRVALGKGVPPLCEGSDAPPRCERLSIENFPAVPYVDHVSKLPRCLTSTPFVTPPQLCQNGEVMRALWK